MATSTGFTLDQTNVFASQASRASLDAVAVALVELTCRELTTLLIRSVTSLSEVGVQFIQECHQCLGHILLVMMHYGHSPSDGPTPYWDDRQLLLLQLPRNRGLGQSGNGYPSTYQVLDRVRSPKIHEWIHGDTIFLKPLLNNISRI